jgi:hypothetical protein
VLPTSQLIEKNTGLKYSFNANTTPSLIIGRKDSKGFVVSLFQDEISEFVIFYWENDDKFCLIILQDDYYLIEL